jgi:hypothetical protein
MKTNCFAYILLIDDLFHNTEYDDDYGDDYGTYDEELEEPTPAPAMRSRSGGMGQNQSSRSRSASHQNHEEGMHHPSSCAATRFHEEDHVYHSSSNHQAHHQSNRYRNDDVPRATYYGDRAYDQRQHQDVPPPAAPPARVQHRNSSDEFGDDVSPNSILRQNVIVDGHQ